MNRKYLSNLIPSVLAYTLAGIYVVVDGLFVGNACGDAGISAINIAWPLIAVIQALGMGIGTGGAVLFNINRSAGRQDIAVSYLRSTFTLLLLSGAIAIVVMVLNIRTLITLFGASGETLELGVEYARIMLIGGIFQIIATGIVPMIRNNDGAKFAMITMVTGFVFNIIFDWLLVWKLSLGVEGAAYASIGGQLLTAILGIIYMFRKKLPIFKLQFKPSYYLRIARLGISSFGLSICPCVSLMLMNRYAVTLGGDEALAAYAVISYVITIAYAIMQGVADGSQPLISESYSRRESAQLTHYLKLTFVSVEVAAILCNIILFFMRTDLGQMFGTSDEAATMVETKMWIFLVGMFFLGYVKIATASFYATEKALYATLMAYAEPVFVFIILLIAPHFMGLNGVWIAETSAQILNAVLGVILAVLAIRRGYSE